MPTKRERGHMGGWPEYHNVRPYQRDGRRRPNNSNALFIPTLEGASAGFVVGGLLSSSIQTYDNGMWDADPRIVVGGMIVGALIGAISGYTYAKRRQTRW